MTAIQRNHGMLNDIDLHEVRYLFRLKDKWSAITHFCGFVLSVFAAPVLMIRGAEMAASKASMISFMIYILSMIILYGASSAYHSFNISEKGNLILKKIDHTSIFLLIAGTYTPVCITALKGTYGNILLAVIWLIAAGGILFKLCWVTCPKWVSSVMYTVMGWTCLFILPQLLKALPVQAFAWLLAGGLFYTAGAVIYASKPRIFRNPEFVPHEVFHCFVLAGSLCHFILIYRYLVLL